MNNNINFKKQARQRKLDEFLKAQRWPLRGLVVAVAIAALVSVVGPVSTSVNNSANASVQGASSSPTATATPLTAAQIKAVVDSVTLKKTAVLYECPASLKDTKTSLLSIDDYSELGTRSNSFAFNVTLPSGTAAEKFTSWQGHNCTNELQGVTYAWVLANTPVYGTMVGNIPGNEFLKPLVGLVESDLRQYMMDTFHPVLASNPATADVQQYVTGTKDYETFITQVNTLYEQLFNLGDAAHVSYINWEVSGPSLSYPDVVKSSVGDTLPAVTLAIIQKGVCQPVAAILINDQDQRPERAVLPGCVTPTPPSKPHTPTTPPTKTPCISPLVPSNVQPNVCVLPKDINAQPTPIQHVTPLPVTGPGSNTSDPAPSNPINPTTKPGAPVVAPAPGSSPAPSPKPSDPPVASDPPVTGPTPAPTPIANPDK